MGKSPSRHRPSPAKTVGIVTALLLLITCAIVVMLAVNDVIRLPFAGDSQGRSGSGYRNVTLTDAVMECETYAREKFEDRLRFITLDRHSSRYEERANRFKVYFLLDMYGRGKSTGLTSEFFLNCFVHGSRGTITHFETAENKPDEPGARRKSEGGLFGL